MSQIDEILDPHKKREQALKDKQTTSFETTIHFGDNGIYDPDAKGLKKVFQHKQGSQAYENTGWVVGVLGDLKEISDKGFHILNYLDEEIITRTVKFHEGEVIIIPGEGNEAVFPEDTVIMYEPWTFDRGSYLIHGEPAGHNEWVKLCTEYDPTAPL